MKQVLLLTLTLFITFNVHGQINLQDSTVQVIGYWDKKETQTYIITNEKYKVNGADTTGREFVKYEVDVTVTDSTANSYTIEWLYRNIQLDTDNQLAKKLAAISDNMKVIIKTDEMGAFTEIVNWQEVRDYIKKTTAVLRADYKHIPNMSEIITQVENTFSTKEAIQATAIKDVHQFYTYHGGKYTLGEEVKGQLELPNIYGAKPFKADVTLQLDEINAEENNSIIRMWQTIDPNELSDATYNYLAKMSTSTGTKLPEKDKLPQLQNETRTASRIHGPSGWVIYSVETKEVSADEVLSFEERIIEIK